MDTDITNDVIVKTCRNNFLLDIVNKDKSYNYSKIREELNNIFNEDTYYDYVNNKKINKNGTYVNLYSLSQYMSLFEEISDYLTHKDYV